ncbi:MAG: DsbA family protein [Patescibacteria group bacterium]
MVSHSSNPWKTATFVLAGVFLGVLIALPLSQNVDLSFLKPDPQKKAHKEFVKKNEADWKFYDANTTKTEDGFYMLGKKDAPLQLVEYTDYQCPYCKSFFSETFGQIRDTYVKTNQLNVTIRDLPLSFHPNAIPAALAAQCAGEQNKYFQMHDLLFDFYDDWADQRDPSIAFNKFADALDLKEKDFETCYQTKKYASHIQKSLQIAEKDGARGTPFFLINGTPFPGGALPFQYFQQGFQAVLSANAAQKPSADVKVPAKK